MNEAYEAACYMVGPLPTNCYVIRKKASSSCLVVDPGPGASALAEKLKDQGLTPAAILVTHGHSDHVDGLAALMEGLAREGLKIDGLQAWSAESERDVFSDPGQNVSEMITGERKTYAVDSYMKDGEERTFGGMKVVCLYTPGHTAGGCSFYLPDAGVVFSGDSLFSGSVGRTDFPGGSMSALVRSVSEKILTLPENTDVLPGHGDFTTVAREKVGNPYFYF